MSEQTGKDRPSTANPDRTRTAPREHGIAGDEDSSGNRPEEQRPSRSTPLEDERGRSERGHPGSTDNFRGSH
jgi:hypothetical protein